MLTVPDKSQKPQTSSTGVCPRCQGKKCVESNNKTVTCPVCRGTGQASNGYMTK